MADIRYTPIVNRWKTFYQCDCPERPASSRDPDVFDWYIHHINHCAPRRVKDIHLPAYPIEELA